MLPRNSDLDRRWPRRIGLLFAVAVVAAVVGVGLGGGVPGPPHRLYGTVTDQNGTALAGATVEVVYGGQTVATATANASGFYDVSVEDPDVDKSGETLALYVNGNSTGATTTWESAASERRDLTGTASNGTYNPTTTPTTTAATTTSTTTTTNGGSNGGGNPGGSNGGSPAGSENDATDPDRSTPGDDSTPDGTVSATGTEGPATNRTATTDPAPDATTASETPDATTTVGTTTDATTGEATGDATTFPDSPAVAAVGGAALFALGAAGAMGIQKLFG
ncbi:carboxypeptidase-like regulatory domain-containing protein [Halorussus caseinilyticus]|uniref:carboxypeptidase-like regulatory domain-containing protein n=1 Tax=Halorussus caseinilyticus TaxID=3034025 RepID=UPI0023E7CC91|nr:carboxypeptidase-like regulatory domain-containing protein [Halorussus sp. DT72]